MKELHVIEQECQKIEFRPQSNVSSDGFDDAILIKDRHAIPQDV